MLTKRPKQFFLTHIQEKVKIMIQKTLSPSSLKKDPKTKKNLSFILLLPKIFRALQMCYKLNDFL